MWRIKWENILYSTTEWSFKPVACLHNHRLTSHVQRMAVLFCDNPKRKFFISHANSSRVTTISICVTANFRPLLPARSVLLGIRDVTLSLDTQCAQKRMWNFFCIFQHSVSTLSHYVGLTFEVIVWRCSSL